MTKSDDVSVSQEPSPLSLLAVNKENNAIVGHYGAQNALQRVQSKRSRISHVRRIANQVSNEDFNRDSCQGTGSNTICESSKKRFSEEESTIDMVIYLENNGISLDSDEIGEADRKKSGKTISAQINKLNPSEQEALLNCFNLSDLIESSFSMGKEIQKTIDRSSSRLEKLKTENANKFSLNVFRAVKSGDQQLIDNATSCMLDPLDPIIKLHKDYKDLSQAERKDFIVKSLYNMHDKYISEGTVGKNKYISLSNAKDEGVSRF